METIHISSTAAKQVIDITGKVSAAVFSSGVKNGMCLVFAQHTTASVLLIEIDGRGEEDILSSLSNLVPKNAKYEHDHSTPEHGAAHVKAAILGSSKVIPVQDGKLQLGTWQSIVFCELDGPRKERKVIVQVVGK